MVRDSRRTVSEENRTRGGVRVWIRKRSGTPKVTDKGNRNSDGKGRRDTLKEGRKHRVTVKTQTVQGETVAGITINCNLQVITLIY